MKQKRDGFVVEWIFQGCLVFSLCGVRQNHYVFSLYRNPDLDDWIFNCLPASIAAVQAEDIRDSFLFVLV